MPIENISSANLQLIVPNLHRRYSGVTATNRMVAPKLATLFRAGWLGSDAPDGIARIGLADLAKLWRRRNSVIWHARRNNEMIVGVLLRALGWPLKLVFTSAAQRHHTWITRWLIRQMDAIIATSEISKSFLRREATVVMHGVDTDAYAPPARSRRGVRRSRIAGPLRHRVLRPGTRAKGQRRFRGGDVPAVAALSRFHRRHGRRHHAGAGRLRRRLAKADRRRGAAIAHRHHRANLISRRCRAGTSG